MDHIIQRWHFPPSPLIYLLQNASSHAHTHTTHTHTPDTTPSLPQSRTSSLYLHKFTYRIPKRFGNMNLASWRKWKRVTALGFRTLKSGKRKKRAHVLFKFFGCFLGGAFYRCIFGGVTIKEDKGMSTLFWGSFFYREGQTCSLHFMRSAILALQLSPFLL